MYHKDLAPPDVPGKDNVTGEDLVQRVDDNPNTARRRLQSYKEVTAPIIDYYKKQNLVEIVDANPRSIDLVYRRMVASISKKCPSLIQPTGELQKKIEKLSKECELHI